MNCDSSLNVSPLQTDVMLIAKCCNKKIIRKNAESDMATFRAIDVFKMPDLLMTILKVASYRCKFNRTGKSEGNKD